MDDGETGGTMIQRHATVMTPESLRLQALDDLEQWGTAPEERFDRITRLARELFGVRTAQINLLGEDHLFMKSPQTPGRPAVHPREGAFCDTTIESPDILVVEDATLDDRFSAADAVVGEPHIRFYAGLPLTVSGGQRVGTLCLVDPAPRGFSDDEHALLERMGSWVERELREILDRDRATTVQRSMFPLNRVDQEEVAVAGLCLPIRDLSGDFYDWHGDEDELTFTLADVMGKGTGAALTAASIRSAFRARTGLAPAEALRSVSDQLDADFEASESFATVLHGRLDRRTGRLDYVDAGHGLTIVIRASGEIENLAATGLPLGIAALIGWTGKSTHLGVGDMLVSTTDGLLDLFDDSADPIRSLATFGVPGSTAEETLDRIRVAVAAGAPADDVTAIVIARHR
jgi:sigma-B regulation protein RsbU (phosphoserine phosphatase)